jgi:hypothetical protein
MAWLPELRQRITVLEFRVPADDVQVMATLTDPVRRERQFAEQRAPGSPAWKVVRRSGGRLRADLAVADGNRTWHRTIDDVAIRARSLHRAHRTRVRTPWMPPLQWVVHERITIEPAGTESDITVRTWARLSVLSYALAGLGYRPFGAGKGLVTAGASQAKATAAAITHLFTAAGDPGAS